MSLLSLLHGKKVLNKEAARKKALALFITVLVGILGAVIATRLHLTASYYLGPLILVVLVNLLKPGVMEDPVGILVKVGGILLFAGLGTTITQDTIRILKQSGIVALLLPLTGLGLSVCYTVIVGKALHMATTTESGIAAATMPHMGITAALSEQLHANVGVALAISAPGLILLPLLLPWLIKLLKAS